MTFALWFRLASPDEESSARPHRPRLVRATPARDAVPTDTDPTIAEIRAGNLEAFERLFRAEYPGLVRFAVRYTRSVDVAEDLVTDVFTAIWEQRSAWHAERGVRAYLYGAVRNRAINAVRDAQRRVEIETSLAAGKTSPTTGAPPEAPDVAWERAEPLRALEHVLTRLSPRTRLVLELRWQHQLDFEEIAAVMGTTRATAFNLHARAMRVLRQIFPQAYREYLG